MAETYIGKPVTLPPNISRVPTVNTVGAIGNGQYQGFSGGSSGGGPFLNIVGQSVSPAGSAGGSGTASSFSVPIPSIKVQTVPVRGGATGGAPASGGATGPYSVNPNNWPSIQTFKDLWGLNDVTVYDEGEVGGVNQQPTRPMSYLNAYTNPIWYNNFNPAITFDQEPVVDARDFIVEPEPMSQADKGKPTNDQRRPQQSRGGVVNKGKTAPKPKSGPKTAPKTGGTGIGQGPFAGRPAGGAILIPPSIINLPPGQRERAAAAFIAAAQGGGHVPSPGSGNPFSGVHSFGTTPGSGSVMPSQAFLASFSSPGGFGADPARSYEASSNPSRAFG